MASKAQAPAAPATPWHVCVLVAAPVDRPVDDFMQALAEQIPDVSVGHPRPTDPIDVRFVIDAVSPVYAIRAADDAVDEALRRLRAVTAVVGVEALTPAQFDERERHPYVPPLVTQAEIAKRIGAHPSRGGQLVRKQPGRFPVATRTDAGTPLFFRVDLDEFAASERVPHRPRRADAEPVAAAG